MLVGCPNNARTRLCRICAEINDRDCPLSASLQLSTARDRASQAVYKTAALPAELHRRETLGIVADSLTSLRKPTFHLRILP
jgi:hypothetical protein